MTETNAADNRRATTLAVHYGRQDQAGVDAVLAEALQADRITPLITAVLDLHAGIVPTLHTPDGQTLLAQMLHDLAADRDGDPDCARAARLIVAHSEGNADGCTTVLREAADADRVAETIVGVLAVFRAYVPVLYGELGLSVLQRNIIGWAAREEDDRT